MGLVSLFDWLLGCYCLPIAGYCCNLLLLFIDKAIQTTTISIARTTNKTTITTTTPTTKKEIERERSENEMHFEFQYKNCIGLHWVLNVLFGGWLCITCK